MRRTCGLGVALVGAMMIVAPRVDAAALRIGKPVEIAPGWARITGRYDSAGVEAAFRALARCPGSDADARTLEGIVHVAPAQSMVWLDLPGTPQRLTPASMPCDEPELSVEMLVDTTVVATARLNGNEPTGSDFLLAEPPAETPTPGRLSLKGQKYLAPSGKRSEAGLQWLLASGLSIQLNYQRTAQPPTMSFDHDDGILTRLLLGF